MVQSTWGSWFIHEEIEASEPTGANVWYLGCNGFVIRSATTTIYIDPYFGTGDPPRLVRRLPIPMNPADATECDAILVTHEHIDHAHPPSYAPLLDLGAQLFAPSACFGPDRQYDGDMLVPSDQRRLVEVGDSVSIGDFSVSVRGANDPDAVEPVSYVLDHPSGTFFHGGDSRPAEIFSQIGTEFDINLGVLAYGSGGRIRFPEENATRATQWYMDENELITAANALNLDRLIPSHWDMWRGMEADPKALHDHATSFQYPKIIERVQIGDRLHFDEPGIQPARSLQS